MNKNSIIIDDKLILHLSELSLLQFDEKEKKVISEDLENLLMFCNKVHEFDEVKNNNHKESHSTHTVYRTDKIKEDLLKKDALQLANNKNKNFFLVPKVIEK